MYNQYLICVYSFVNNTWFDLHFVILFCCFYGAVLPDQISKDSWNARLKSSQKVHVWKLKIGRRRNTSETVGMYGNSRINTRRHLRKGYPF